MIHLYPFRLCLTLADASSTAKTGKSQKDWMSKIQARVAMTSKVIATMKSLKISGLALPIQSSLQNLRLEELRVGGKFRMILCWSVVLAYVPLFISPVATFACK